MVENLYNVEILPGRQLTNVLTNLQETKMLKILNGGIPSSSTVPQCICYCGGQSNDYAVGYAEGKAGW